jgi:hypothetical protein
MNYVRNHAIVLIALMVVVAVFVGYSVGSPTTVESESAGYTRHEYKKWLVVEWKVRTPDEQRDWDKVTSHRYHVVSPEGVYYIIPDVHKKWAGKIEQGEEVYLPRTLRDWPTALDSGHPGSKTPESHPAGWCDFTKSEESGNRHMNSGIYFFVY